MLSRLALSLTPSSMIGIKRSSSPLLKTGLTASPSYDETIAFLRRMNRQSALMRIETIGVGGGYMISSANSITSYCKIENVHAMVEAIRKYAPY